MTGLIVIKSFIYKNKSIIYLSIGITIGLLPSSCSEQYGINIGSADWMPTTATDGCFYQGPAFIFGPPYYYYEYSCSESDFIEQFKDIKSEIHEIKGTVVVDRYLIRFIRHRDFDFESDDGIKKYNEIISVSVKNGLSYKWSKFDRSKSCVYDRDRKRAFIYISTR